ncbi:MAG TPA: hypothetical protein DCY20_00445 [Firmicutes bacterium]|nr:hypothetical protein [Bacillota bacterium]
MKKILFLTLIFISLIGCEKESSLDEVEQSQKVEVVVEDIKQVKVSGEVNLVVDKAKDIEIIGKAINQSTRIAGILDVAPSNLTLELMNNDGKTDVVWLWLPQDEGDGMMMFETDTHTGYKLRNEDKVALLVLIFGLE